MTEPVGEKDWNTAYGIRVSQRIIARMSVQQFAHQQVHGSNTGPLEVYNSKAMGGILRRHLLHLFLAKVYFLHSVVLITRGSCRGCCCALFWCGRSLLALCTSLFLHSCERFAGRCTFVNSVADGCGDRRTDLSLRTEDQS